MKIIRTIEEMKNFSKNYRTEHPQKKIAFVATMGFLHEGHRSLMRQASSEADCLVVSIFVNPTQFNNAQDLQTYPQDENRDKEICLQENVSVLFMPSQNEVYPAKPNSYSNEKLFLDYPKLTSQLCGKFRPGHFSGVLWIVHNLLLWTNPHAAYFGLKDFQQFILIRQMAFDLSLQVDIRPAKLIRQENGLALSSRNSRLSEQGKESALRISQSLFAMQKKITKQEKLTKQEALAEWQKLLAGLNVEYADIYDAATLQPLPNGVHPTEAKNGYLLAIAVYIEDVRLIDNVHGGNIGF